MPDGEYPYTYKNEDLSHRPTPVLMKEFVEDGRELIREELSLAKQELRHEAKKAAKGGAFVGAGGAVVYAAVLCLAATLVAIGWSFMPLWVSASIVTVIFGAVGAALIANGKKKLKLLQPERPLKNLQEDRRWAKETMRSMRSKRHAHT